MLHSTPMAILERTSSCVRPPCLMSLHASRLTHGMHGCECGSVDADCGSMCKPFMRALVVCAQIDYFTLCGTLESTFCDVMNVYG